MRGRGFRDIGWGVLRCGAVLALGLALPASGQFQPANHFPSIPVDDGKFLALAGSRFATLSSGNLSFGLVVPPTAPESSHPCEAPLSGECIYLAVFDGDTQGESADAEAIADYEDFRSLFPGFFPATTTMQHWDNLTPVPGSVPTVTGNRGTQLGFALFADANQVANRKKKNLLGVWLGDRADNLARDDVADPRWIAFAGDFEDPGFSGRGADLTSFPDNGWWNLELELNGCEVGDPGCPLSATGANSFHLCIFYNPDPSTFPAALSTLLAGYGPDDDVGELCSSNFDPTGSFVRVDDFPRTVSNFKLKGETDIQLLSRSFAFDGAQHNLADTSVLIPGWTPLKTRPQSPSYDPSFFVNLTPCDPLSPTPPCTRYDGTWVFNLVLPETSPRRELRLFDGDFDYGTLPDPPLPGSGELPGETGFPSGQSLAACQDDSDGDSPASPEFVAAKGPEISCVTGGPDPTFRNLCRCEDLPPGVTKCSRDGTIDEGAKPHGTPADDNPFDQFRFEASPDPAVWPEAERKCLVYEVRSPGANGVLEARGDPLSDDVIYRNPNPSSQREWEQFRIVSRCEVTDTDPAIRQCGCSNAIASLPACPAGFPPQLEEVFDPSLPDAAQADVVVSDPRLPAGTWEVAVYGVDLSNLNAWSTDLQFCPADNAFCGTPTPPYKVGDTVWNDTDFDGRQSNDELGKPGVLVTLSEAGQQLASKATGDEDLDTNTSCEDLNTGGDPSGPADPPTKMPVDEEGLYCFGVDIPPLPRTCSVTTTQTCLGDGNCPAGETCLPPPPGNHCSVTTSQLCSSDGDCPSGETCTQTCRDLQITVEDVNFEPGGALDGFGPTTPSPTTDCQVCAADGGAVTLNCDFGYAPCGECDGKVSRLILEYLGDSAAVVRVEQRKGDIVFEGVVEPGGFFSFEGADRNGTLGSEIDVYVDGAFHVQIHTSCSQPIFAGLVVGDFRVAAGLSRNGGPLCTDEDLDQCGCEGKVTFLRLQYNGSSAATVSVEQKNGDLLFGPSQVFPGEQFDLGAGTVDNTYGTDIFVYVDGTLHTTIHTSCSQPIGPGLQRGDFEVISGRSKEGGNLCPL